MTEDLVHEALTCVLLWFGDAVCKADSRPWCIQRTRHWLRDAASLHTSCLLLLTLPFSEESWSLEAEKLASASLWASAQQFVSDVSLIFAKQEMGPGAWILFEAGFEEKRERLSKACEHLRNVITKDHWHVLLYDETQYVDLFHVEGHKTLARKRSGDFSLLRILSRIFVVLKWSIEEEEAKFPHVWPCVFPRYVLD